MEVSRRRVLAVPAPLLLSGVAGRVGRTVPARSDAGFLHGVASGDPLPDRVVLWTRLTVPAGTGTQRVGWEITGDGGFTASGTVAVDGSTDWCVKVDAGGLPAGRDLEYRFRWQDLVSPTGRTRTAPPPGRPVDRLRLALCSCSNHEHGHFGAYADIAAADVDLVVHVGDYVYEGSGAALEGRRHQPPTVVSTLDGYRRRYAQYRSDPDLQAAHAAHPWAVVWDDHEVADNAWNGGASGHRQNRDGGWASRRAAAVRAWHEWLPVRRPDPADPLRIWRSLGWGDLARLVLLDSRLHGRDRQQLDPAAAAAPGRDVLGQAQWRWLDGEVVRPGARWLVLANQVMASQKTFGFAAQAAGFGATATTKAADDWTGYPASQERLARLLGRHARGRAVVLTGDFHSAWALQLLGADGAPVALEVVTPSITSQNLGERYQRQTVELANRLLADANPNVAAVDLGGHGWVEVTLTPEAARAGYRFVETTLTRSPAAGERFAFEAAWGEPAWRPPADQGSGAPPGAPPPGVGAGGPGGGAGADEAASAEPGGSGFPWPAAAAAAGGGALAAGALVLGRRRRGPAGERAGPGGHEAEGGTAAAPAALPDGADQA